MMSAEDNSDSESDEDYVPPNEERKFIFKLFGNFSKTKFSVLLFPKHFHSFNYINNLAFVDEYDDVQEANSSSSDSEAESNEDSREKLKKPKRSEKSNHEDSSGNFTYTFDNPENFASVFYL